MNQGIFNVHTLSKVGIHSLLWFNHACRQLWFKLLILWRVPILPIRENEEVPRLHWEPQIIWVKFTLTLTENLTSSLTFGFWLLFISLYFVGFIFRLSTPSSSYCLSPLLRLSFSLYWTNWKYPTGSFIYYGVYLLYFVNFLRKVLCFYLNLSN